MSEVYDWTYKGPRWRYRVTLRPPSSFTTPQGRIIGADKPPAYEGKRFDYGTVEYARPLTEYEQSHYDLILVAETSDDGTWTDWERIEGEAWQANRCPACGAPVDASGLCADCREDRLHGLV